MAAAAATGRRFVPFFSVGHADCLEPPPIYQQWLIDAQVEGMLTAAVREAGVDTAILTINATRRVWVLINDGFQPGAFPWCWSAWQTRAPVPQLLVVPDTLHVPRCVPASSSGPQGLGFRFHLAVSERLDILSFA